jgi:hypothetical protein
MSMRRWVGIVLCLALGCLGAWLIACFSPAAPASASELDDPLATVLTDTLVFQGGTLTEDTTLLPDGSPYVITDTIFVTEGVTLTVQPGVTLQFQPGRSLVVEGRLVAVGTPAAPVVFTRHATAPWGAIVFRDTPADNYIAHAVVEHAMVDGHNPYWQGVIAYNSRLRLAHSTVRHLGLMGLTLENSQALVTDNVIHDVRVDGIHVVWGSVVVSGNHIYDAYEGIELEFVDTPAVLRDNHVHDIADDCIDLDASAAVIERNRLHHCGDKGVSTSYTSTVTLVNNLIYANAEGMAVQDGSCAHLVNNTLTGNELGIGLHNHYLDNGGSAMLVNSVVWGNGTDLELRDGFTVTVIYSDVPSGTEAVWPGEGNISADPLFLAPQDHVYRLAEDSPCVDAGTSVGAPGDDIRGLPRPHGERHDLGGYEFSPFFFCHLPLVLRPE